MQKCALTLLCLLFAVTARSQCSIATASTRICAGQVALFSAPVSAADSAYAWNFGDGGTSTQASPSYQYAATGTFTVSLRVYAFGNTYCDAPAVQVRVFARPVAAFQRVTAYAQCFEHNLFSFADSSKAGPSNAPIAQRTMLFDDGAFVVQQAPFSAGLSHRYNHPGGNKYRVVLEVKDTNGCIAQAVDSLVVHPQMPGLILEANQNIQCGFTDVVFNNGGGYTASNTQKITWIMGNGDTLYSPAQPFNHVSYRYQDTGTFFPRIIVEDRNGCLKDTAGNEVIGYEPDSSLLISNPAQCYRNNQFMFSNPSARWSSVAWTYQTTEAVFTRVHTWPNKSDLISFGSCGPVDVRMELSYGGCTIVKDTQVFVYGPKAVLMDPVQKPTNMEQCQARDTVMFRLPDLNCYYKDSGIHFLWDFYDPFAPPCTTDTRRNINVGMNCNFSVDSMNVGHYYSQTRAACYTPRMWVIDSISGCFDSVNIDLRITPPDAGWDSTVVPVRKGVYYRPDPQEPCLPRVFFYFDEMIPMCGPEEVWLLGDSACVPHIWKKVSTRGSPFSYMFNYDAKCTPGNRLTYGIVAKNGHACYDTAWYPLELMQTEEPEVLASVRDAGTCKPFEVRFSLRDSVRQDIERIVCNFGDNSLNYVKSFNLTDTVVPGFSHTYTAARRAIYTLIFYYRNGCAGSWQDTLYLGKDIGVVNNFPHVCFPDSASFSAYPGYLQKDAPDHWADPLRAAQGKEALYWNFGDDDTWTQAGKEVKHFYAAPGLYQVSVAYKDSTPGGCFDTVAFPSMRVQVSRLNKKIVMANDTFFCAPTIINYIDSSVVAMSDSTVSDTLIADRVWNFGPGRPVSVLVDPSVFYASNGAYQTRLELTTKFGCVSDTTINIAIVGPEPVFTIPGDTFGCAPFTVRVKNETLKQLVNWIWYFNDPFNQVFSTSRDTDFTFTYTQPGVYRIDLVGEDRIFNTITQTFTNCSQKFPYVDPANGFHSRQVTVLKTDTLRIVSPDTVCEGERFRARAEGTVQVAELKWLWGDQSSTTAGIADEAAHAYDTSGAYLIEVQPVIMDKSQCVLPAAQEVRVTMPVADFMYDSSEYPSFSFQNLSANAVRYVWDFGQPSSAANSSAEINPVHNYGNENRVFKVCLMAFDLRDCFDSVCRILPLRSSVKIPNVFTPGNNDGKNDAFDIEIEGWETYELHIYNRWGTLVYQSLQDGREDDGINWNGLNRNDGKPCPEGVYYVVFKYKLMTGHAPETYHGTVTLIRE